MNPEKTTHIEEQSFDPLLSAPVIERDYTTPNISVDPNEDIMEPTFSAPPEEEQQEEEPGNGPKEEPRQANPDYTDLSSKEKKEGAELMADAILDGYSSIIGYAGNLATISERKLTNEIVEGNINPNLTLETDDQGNEMKVMQFVSSYNESAKETFSVSKEFKETVKPPLTRVLQKRGAAMTDEQFLMFHFGKDVLEKSVSAFVLRSQNNQILEMLRERTINEKMQVNVSQQPSAPEPEPKVVRVQDEEEIIKPSPTQTTNRRNNQSKKAKVLTEEQTFSIEPLPNAEFSQPYVAPNGMPEFGNKDLLDHMEKASKTGKNQNAKKATTRGSSKKQ